MSNGINEAQAAIDAAIPTVATPLTKDQYADRRIRKGKTARERASGAKNKNYQNRESRAAWQKDSKSSFPWSSCNGQRNRYQVTGRGGETIFLGDKKK